MASPNSFVGKMLNRGPTQDTLIGQAKDRAYTPLTNLEITPKQGPAVDVISSTEVPTPTARLTNPTVLAAESPTTAPHVPPETIPAEEPMQTYFAPEVGGSTRGLASRSPEFGGPPAGAAPGTGKVSAPAATPVPLPRERPPGAILGAPSEPVSWRDDAPVRYANPADQHDSEYNVQAISPRADPAENVRQVAAGVARGAKSLVTSGPIGHVSKAAVDTAGKAVEGVKGWWKRNIRIDHPAMVSAAGETGRADWSRQGQVANDTGGSKSYGVFGLNTLGGSRSSAAQFTREYGKSLGITAPIGTAEYARQWQAAAQNNPEGLKQAQLKWWDKNVGSKVSSSLVSLGVPKSVSEHPAVKAYFADRMVQYGPNLGAYSGRVQRAWATSGGSPDKFMRGMNGQDAASIKRDFRSYLRGHPNNTGGLANRISKRYHLSSAVASSPTSPAVRAYDGTATDGVDSLGGIVDATKGLKLDWTKFRQSENVEDFRSADAITRLLDGFSTAFAKHSDALNRKYWSQKIDENNPLAKELGIQDVGKSPATFAERFGSYEDFLGKIGQK